MQSNNGRLESLDALRGFDMFFIMGGEALLAALAVLFGFPDFEKGFGHVPWHGLQFMDTVFPLFLFMAGITLPFSVAASRAKGASENAIALKCLKRGCLLVLLGLIHDGPLLSFNFAHMRIWSVLGRIGIAWMLGSFLFLRYGLRARLLIAVGILVFTTLFFGHVLAFDAASGADPFSAAGNFGCYIDRLLGHSYQPMFDPEGFAGLLPAVVTAMLGTFAGEFVRNSKYSGGVKTFTMFVIAAVLAAAGWFMNSSYSNCIGCHFPINKALWSPSFVLAVGGYSFAIFALFYWIIDVRGWKRWTFFFKVIGMNSIAIYMAQQLFCFWKINDTIFGGFVSLFPECAAKSVYWATYTALCWFFLYFLYRKSIFLKV